MKEALFYKQLSGDRKGFVQCQLCPHNCTIAENKKGICGVRKNNGGRLYSLVYGRLCSMNVDPIEKKPLFHFAPGTDCLSICTVGCNLTCSFCQNSEISHPADNEVFGKETSPEQIISIAKEHHLPGIAYTYTEPAVAWEFYIEVMKLARKAGLYNVWVSNGYISPEPAKKIAKHMDAINVDMKGDVKFYQKLCGVPDEEPIRKALKIYRKAGVWIEVTNLIIPGFNDKPAQVKELAAWVKGSLGQDTPLHFSRFHPYYRMTDVEPTPVETLEMAYEAARKAGLKWVYIGNVPGHGHGTLETSRKDKDTPIAGKKWLTNKKVKSNKDK
jgi:pyruvate formate lyase activating enzyme